MTPEDPTVIYMPTSQETIFMRLIGVLPNNQFARFLSNPLVLAHCLAPMVNKHDKGTEVHAMKYSRPSVICHVQFMKVWVAQVYSLLILKEDDFYHHIKVKSECNSNSFHKKNISHISMMTSLSAKSNANATAYDR